MNECFIRDRIWTLGHSTETDRHKESPGEGCEFPRKSRLGKESRRALGLPSVLRRHSSSSIPVVYSLHTQHSSVFL